MDDLMNREVRITSVELVGIINDFRVLESEAGGKPYKELRHDSFMAKIDKELEVLKTLNLDSLQNILESTYTNERGKTYRCYSLNRDGMLQMLNSESTLVRFKTIQYIDKLEKAMETKKLDSYMIDDKVERAKRWIEEEEERRRLALENKENKPKVDYYEKVLEPKDEENGYTKLLTSTEVAKDLGISAKKLHDLLHEKRIIYKQGKSWVFYSQYQDRVPEYADYHVNDHGQTLKWTEKGRKWIIELLGK